MAVCLEAVIFWPLLLNPPPASASATRVNGGVHRQSVSQSVSQSVFSSVVVVASLSLCLVSTEGTRTSRKAFDGGEGGEGGGGGGANRG